jgi:Flp pilus assembly protein TadD
VVGGQAAPPAPAPPAAEPLRPRTRAERGIDAFRSGNIQDAVRLLEEAREEMPRSIRVLTYLGAAYYAAKRYADAENALTRALAMRPDLATVRYNLANAMLAQGKRAAAKVELQKAWDQDPTCTPALLVLVSLEGTPES